MYQRSTTSTPTLQLAVACQAPVAANIIFTYIPIRLETAPPQLVAHPWSASVVVTGNFLLTTKYRLWGVVPPLGQRELINNIIAIFFLPTIIISKLLPW